MHGTTPMQHIPAIHNRQRDVKQALQEVTIDYLAHHPHHAPRVSTSDVVAWSAHDPELAATSIQPVG